MKPKLRVGRIKKPEDRFAVIETPDKLTNIGEIELHHKTKTFKRGITGNITVVPIADLEDMDKFSVSVHMPDEIWTEENYKKHFKSISVYAKI